MMIPSGSEVALEREEVDLLRTQVARLRELVAELLVKNQSLRETLEKRTVQACFSKSLGANGAVR